MAEHNGKKNADGGRAGIAVVGIGASAGGLEALKSFFEAMPPDSGMAFVIIQHLEPTHESRAADLLASSTSMPVAQANDGVAVQANHVYTNAAGTYLSVRDGRFALSSLPGHGMRMPIDYFFGSLATERGDEAICIILSGSSAADGVGGVRAVRCAGGICIVQDPATAQFAPMPQGVIDTGLADYVLQVERMPAALLAYSEHLAQTRHNAEEGSLAAPEEINAIIELIHRRTNNDFSHYKKATVMRRIQRRMALNRTADFADYLKLLTEDATELTQLSGDMLIGVSSFFRDKDAFEELYSNTIVPLVNSKNYESPVRVWVAGCSTGEEAYSLAMLLAEAQDAAGKVIPAQIFASDVDGHALDIARGGLYPKAIAQDVSAERLEKFFTRQGENYQVTKKLREMVIFSRHNLIVDPPFSKLDLITCRNVLIYLDLPNQKRILSMFSFALNVGGYLFLGKSEGISGTDGMYDSIDKRNRIYRLVKARRHGAVDIPMYARGKHIEAAERDRPQPAVAALMQANQEALLRHFDAAIVLVDARGRILHFWGQTEKYLGHPKGLASLNILDMTSGTLSVKLRRAIKKSLEQDEIVVLGHVRLPQEGEPLVDMSVEPVSGRGGEKLVAIFFQDVNEKHPATPAVSTGEDEQLVSQLESEVKALRHELALNVEEYGLADEEFRAANEEVLSMNEELQSANEELQASKEEMQSINEELTIVNSQLSEKMTELTAANDDLANLMTAAEIATIILDGQFRIKRFTPKAGELLNVIPSDIGRPVGHIVQTFGGVELTADAQRTLKTLAVTEKEIQTGDGRWYLMRILPYRTLDNRIDGVVVTFFDVSGLKEIQKTIEHEKAYALSIVETVRNPLLVLDERLHVLSANAAFCRTFCSKPDSVGGLLLYDLGNRQWDIPALRESMERLLSASKTSIDDFEVEHDFREIGKRTMILNACRIEGYGGGDMRILLAIEDVTEARLYQKQMIERNEAKLKVLSIELSQAEQRERQNLAHVLHDNLQQFLVAAKLQLDAIEPLSHEPSRNAIDLVKDFLEKSIQASRSLTVELSPMILFKGGLDAALQWLARQMEANYGLTVETRIHAHIELDEDGITIVLFHSVRELLFNIVKHAGVQFAIVELDRIDGEQIRISVSDKGSGFDPSSLVSDIHATGLGLGGMLQRIKNIGGRIDIQSKPGQGTVVTIEVRVRRPKSPVAVAKVEVGESSNGATATPEAAAGETPNIRVLVADDHTIVRKGLCGILKREKGIEVVAEAADGKQALEMARLSKPDVILMDVSMPHMNGVEATKAIISEMPSMRIIGLSMYDEQDIGQAIRNAGAMMYLNKGCPAEELAAAVKKVHLASQG